MGDEEVEGDYMKLSVTITFDPSGMTESEAIEYAQMQVADIVKQMVNDQGDDDASME